MNQRTLFPAFFSLLPRLLTIALLLLAAGCSLAEPPIRGVVVEEGSGRPLADATVYIMWSAQGSAAGLGSYSACVGIDFAQSDSEGRFELPGRGGTGYVQAYKPGYEWFYRVDKHGNVLLDPLSKPQTVSMRPFAGTVTEWLDVGGRILNPQGICRGAKGASSQLIPFYRTLYQDAKAFAAKSPVPLTEKEKSRLRGFRYQFEEMDIGEGEASNRMKMRRLRGEY